jgi:hypothetical protein
MDNDTFTLIFAFLLLLLAILVFVKISMRVRKSGGSLMTTMHGATYEFLNKDKREAIEQIVEIKANKKMDDEDFGELKK